MIEMCPISMMYLILGNGNHFEGAVDYVEWTTSNGKTKSTNRIDDIIELTEKGEELIKQIQAGTAKDKLCWSWVMYCAGNSCQHLCGGIGKCNPDCQNANLPNNLKNIYNDVDHWTADDVKNKILVSKQGATEADLHQEVVKNRDICNNKQLKRLIIRDDRRVKNNSGPWTVLQNYIQDLLKPGNVLDTLWKLDRFPL
ncbi:hypothetical protein C1645_877563 [Glomus cerebriforme]|uniref:Uncharacterized protein n=1 Tax=Glomus cerebriforme TaxID=658196 RepID=A0A397SPS3_9GLOM|nr:hypothetical protein C1645_877563 [Glomus cerebriforme]